MLPFTHLIFFLFTKLFYFFFNVYLFLGQRETEHEQARGRERGRHRIGSRLQAPSHQPRARRGARTHRPRDRDLAEVGRLTDCATQAPPSVCLLKRNTCSCLLPFFNWIIYLGAVDLYKCFIHFGY